MKFVNDVKSKFKFLCLLLFLSTLISIPYQALAGQANLTWNSIATYSDGTPMSNLGGYRIYSGTAAGTYTNKVDVGNLTSYTMNNLADGVTHYFAITAYDTLGNESSYSNELSHNVPAQASTYTLTATAASGGSITAPGATSNQATNGTSTITTVSVAQGASQAFSITPATGYSIAGVTVDGVSVGAVASYTFSNVTANHSIAATFKANTTTGTVSTYALTASAGTGGSISPSGTVSVSSGTSKAFTVTPSSGYSIASVMVDGVSVGAVASYTFSNVTANHTISASFKANTTTTTAGTVVFAANCGGSAFTDATGVKFQADTKFIGGATNSTTAAIPVTINDTLYQSWRYGNMSYSIPMANGNYSVTLKFSDWYTKVGQRVFNVAMQGVTVLSNFDIFAKAGGTLNPYDVTIPVTVSNGTLTIKFTNVVDNAKINAIVVKTR